MLPRNSGQRLGTAPQRKWAPVRGEGSQWCNRLYRIDIPKREASTARAVCSASKIPELIVWLIEASLLSSGQETRVLPKLLASPSLFPFDISLSGKEFLDSNSRIALYRQGRNEELVSLR
jgi:hypothetical protein